MPVFLDGGGECGALIKARDWSGSLGPVASWSQSLKAATGLLLRSPVPMVMLWGEDGIMIYNDAYSLFAGGRHPQLLGSKVREGWPEVADFNDHVMKVGLAGGTLSYKDQELTLYRSGAPEQVWMDLDYSPVIGDDGRPAGVLAVVIETTDRIRAVRALRDRERHLEALFQQTSAGIAEADLQGRIITANDRYCEIVGRAREDLLSITIADLTHPDDLPENQVLLGKLLANGESFRIEKRYVRPEGEAVWVSNDVNLVRHEDGQPANIVAVCVETGDRRRAEEALRESEARFRNMADHAPVMLWVTDADGRCTYLNRSWYEFTGQTKEQAEGFGWLDATHPDDRAEAERVFLEANRRGEPFRIEYRLRRHDGKYRWSIDAAAPRFAPTGEFLGYIGSVIDIDERREMEDALRDSEERFRNMADNTPVMLWVTDETGYCTYLNRRWYEYTGQAPGEGAGLGWLKAVHPDDRQNAERVFLTANDEHRPYQVDFRLRHSDGGYRWCADTAEPRFDGSGRFLGYVGSVVDIDERREAAEKVRLSEEMLRSVIEQMPVGVAVARVPSGEIFEYNQALEDMLGHPILSEDASTYNRYGGIDEEGNSLPPEAYPLGRAVMFGETVVGDEMRYRRADGRIIHLLGHASPVIGPTGKPDIAVVTLQDITDRKRAEQHQRLLIDELSHRAKNLLAIIQSVAQQSFKNGSSPAAMVASFEGRLGALAAAHGILTRQRWESAPLRQVICDTITAVKADDHRLQLDGPDLMVAPKTGVSIAMAVHELTTNAVKYGSFSNDEGTVSVTWRIEDGRLKLEWHERGGPPVQPPSKRGFGSRMIERGLAAELGGKVKIDFDPEGVVCRVDAPFAEAD
ncbi:PAS domain-containing sensor histidine kinase [Sphingomonas arenae]|uniref:PAS domain-containing sensor histidine kinase n=1 Tax=Sphingomonas arenae TaxID=2812555 RepID=UPI001967C52F|nr:PAS domain S-box protein [Sphingomonas arenae]